jgi:CheY-like chemotaxis protein
MEEVVLLAEDQEADVILMKRIFERMALPYRLEVVSDGEEAIHYLAGEGKYGDRSCCPFPSLLILDVRMPRKAGPEVLAWIKEREDWPPLFVVTLTSSSQAGPAAETLEQHGKVMIFNCHFLKPATTENVKMIISFFQIWRRKQGLP